MDYTYPEIAKMIEHTLLNPALTTVNLEQGCNLSLDYDIAAVSILPYYMKRCAEILQQSSVRAGTTLGFPHGCQATDAKLAEAFKALDDGAQELDLVINISQVLSGHWAFVRDEIQTIAEAVHAREAKLKVTFENCYLRDPHKIKLCELCTELNVDWVKTSTGYGTAGLAYDDLKLLRSRCGPKVQVHASGGIRDLEAVLRARELGASRVGVSRTKEILDECRRQLAS